MTDLKDFKLDEKLKSKPLDFDKLSKGNNNDLFLKAKLILNALPLMLKNVHWKVVTSIITGVLFILLMSIIGIINSYLYIASSPTSFILFWTTIALFLTYKGIKFIIKKIS